MKRIATLPSDSEILEYHYNYELDMLTNTYRLINDSRIQQNALMESFCLHARNLIEFFCDNGQKYTEISYTPFAKKRTRIGKLNQLINQQISHLDVNRRVADDSKKISDQERSELITILSAETVEFRKHLKQPYLGMSISVLVLMQQQIPTGPTAPSGSATTLPALAPSGSTAANVTNVTVTTVDSV